MLNPDGRLWIHRLSSGLADAGERRPTASELFDSSPTTLAPRSMPDRRASRRNCPKRENGSSHKSADPSPLKLNASRDVMADLLTVASPANEATPGSRQGSVSVLSSR